MHSPSRGTHQLTVPDLRQYIVGIDTRVPVLDGGERPYVFLDNAASTPAFRQVLECVEDFLPWYSGVHRGTGFKSLVATDAFDQAHDMVGNFVGAEPAASTVIFTKNTTESINKLSNRFGFAPDDVVITTVMEHHSNDLPWRKNAVTVHIGVLPDGSPDLGDLQRQLAKYRGRVRLVAVNGASNITGVCPPIHDIARWAHDAEAKIFVDAAQLAPHRPIAMLGDADPGHIDFLALSAHKMYAPFGTGVLIGPREFFEDGDPDVVGGGVVDIVSLNTVQWNHPPLKEEAGSPNVVGGIALAAAITVLQKAGMKNIVEHEQRLLDYAIRKLRRVPGITLYGPLDDLTHKVGVITFNIEGVHHALAAAIMGTEGAIGVRNGCFCAHPYVKQLLGLTQEEEAKLEARIVAGDKTEIPGMVRASLGCYNNEEDVDALVEMVDRIARHDYRGRYVQDKSTGAFHAGGFDITSARYFPFFRDTPPPHRKSYSEAP